MSVRKITHRTQESRASTSKSHEQEQPAYAKGDARFRHPLFSFSLRGGATGSGVLRAAAGGAAIQALVAGAAAHHDGAAVVAGGRIVLRLEGEVGDVGRRGVHRAAG